MSEAVVSRMLKRLGWGTAPSPDAELERALARCRNAARRGYELASKNLDDVSRAIQAARGGLAWAKLALDQTAVRTPEVTTQIEKQLAEASAQLEELHKVASKQLAQQQQRLDTFSITLFGRTMAGKSTLMEVLTNGQGITIGRGAQRTTRDVRRYIWKSLEVTDVPGVAAFEGAEDEEVAYEAARQADLILFLVTDDAPQPVEADHLARVRRLGKPVLGICNVKVAVQDPDDLALFLSDPNAAFDRNRLSDLIRQFHEFADLHAQRVPFVYVHLASRFLANRPENSRRRRELMQASRFQEVERRIVSEVVGRGRFLRVKTFIDTAAAPLQDVAWGLLDFSARNSESGRVLIGKRNALQIWTEAFQTRGDQRISTKVGKIADELREIIPQFADDHWDDENVKQAWLQRVHSAGLAEAAEKLQRTLAGESQAQLAELARELKSELKLVGKFAAERELRGADVFDSKRAWNWGVTITSAGLGMAALILASGPLAWAAAAVGLIGGLFSWFFEDGEAKRRKAKGKLADRLHDHVGELEKNARAKLQKWFREEIVQKQIRHVQDDLQGVVSAVFKLADTQRELAWKLADQACALHWQLVGEALKDIDASKDLEYIRGVARIPGVAVMLLVDRGYRMTEQTKERLERLLGERLWFAVDTRNPVSILKQAIGKAAEDREVSLERTIGVAHVPGLDRSASTIDRVRLAQQLTRLHIME